MGIRFYCPNGCKIHVKTFQAGRRGVCPHCGAGVDIPLQSTRGSSKGRHSPKGSRAKGAPRSSLDGDLPELGIGMGRGSDEETELATPPVAAAPGLENELEAKASGTLRGVPTDIPQKAQEAVGPVPRQPPSLPGGDSLLMTPPPLPEPIAASGPAHPPQPDASPPLGETLRPGLHRPAFSVRSPNEPDPLQDAPDAIWYVCPPTGGQYGPAGCDVMRSWLAEGRITPDSQVWREGWRDWKEAAEVFPEDAFPQLRIPDTVPELERILGNVDSATSPGGPHHGDGRTSLVSHLFITMVLIALGGGILAAVYVWARFY